MNAIEKYCADLQEQMACARSLAPVLEIAERIWSHLGLQRDHGMTGLSIVKFTADLPFICMSIDCDSFHEATPILRELAKEGYHTDKEEPFVDLPELKRRTFNFLNGTEEKIYGCGCCYRLRLHCFIRESEGAKCRMVQVGVQPKYELVCDE